MMKAMCVFCASANGADPAFRAAAVELGRELARREIALIYGGAKMGLMGAVADTVLDAGGRVEGVIPHVLVDKEVAHNGCTELHVVETMHQRKALMAEKADGFLILPGGFGTLEEMFEVLAWSTLRIHAKPVVLLNVNGFYNTLLKFVDECVEKGVLKPKNHAVLLVANTVRQAMAMLDDSVKPNASTVI